MRQIHEPMGVDFTFADLHSTEALAEAITDATKLVWIETPRKFHSRNAFAVGGVLEDPATGAAAAALAGYLRDLDWPHAGAIDIVQGEDMGATSLLHAEIGGTPASVIAPKVRNVPPPAMALMMPENRPARKRRMAVVIVMAFP